VERATQTDAPWWRNFLRFRRAVDDAQEDSHCMTLEKACFVGAADSISLVTLVPVVEGTEIVETVGHAIGAADAVLEAAILGLSSEKADCATTSVTVSGLLDSRSVFQQRYFG
jgi:hypothetical protein